MGLTVTWGAGEDSNLGGGRKGQEGFAGGGKEPSIGPDTERAMP